MTGSDAPGSPIETAVGAGGSTVAAAFTLLSDETRLAILLALWDAYDPYEDGTGLRFSELRDRVGVGDSGQFNYHLEQLAGHFVHADGEGYEITEAGLTFVRSVIAGAGLEEPELSGARIDVPCALCESPAEIEYDDGWVYIVCTHCEGLWTDDDGPAGQLAKFYLDPAGLQGRTPNEVYAAAWVRSYQRLFGMLEGVCPTCSGIVDRSLDVCESHEDEGVCPACDRRDRAVARLRCRVCKQWGQMTLGGVAKYHPAVVAFCHEHGLDLQYGTNDVEHIERRLNVGGSAVDVRSTSPPRVRVTTTMDGEEIAVDLDEDLHVIRVEE